MPAIDLESTGAEIDSKVGVGLTGDRDTISTVTDTDTGTNTGTDACTGAGSLPRPVADANRGGPLNGAPGAVTVGTSQADVAADAGMSTVEYAVGTIVAAAFAAVLYKIVTGDSVVSGLTNLINSALHTSL